jgi:hypothetical protein
MSEVVCFYLQPLGKIRRSLRRFRSSDIKCPKPYQGWDYCNAECFIDELPYPIKQVVESYSFPHDDPRWPNACTGCGAPFKDDDTWQVFVDTLYTRSDTGEVTTIREAPAGAMWDSWWMPDAYRNKTDGLALILKLPGGHTWGVDGPSSSHKEAGAWTRTGTPPKLTASPSILVPGGYHGWLRDGVLVEC